MTAVEAWELAPVDDDPFVVNLPLGADALSALHRGQLLLGDVPGVLDSPPPSDRLLLWASSWIVLVHHHLVGVLAANQISGWRTTPVTITAGAGKLTEFVALSVLGRSDDPDREKSGAVDTVFGQLLKGFWIDRSSWDGADFFMPRGWRLGVFCTDRAKRVLDETVPESVVFTRLSDVEWVP